MSTGIISRLVKSQGFGFIKCSGGHEVFFHRSHVQGDVFESLAQGQNARFKVGIGNGGLQAIDIRPMPETSTSKIKYLLGKKIAPVGHKPAQMGRKLAAGTAKSCGAAKPGKPTKK